MLIYKIIDMSISVVAVITIFCGTWIGMGSLIGHIIDTKSIKAMSTGGMLAEDAKIKLHEFRKNPDNSVRQISTLKHKPSSTICSPGAKKKKKKYKKMKTFLGV